MKICRYMFIVQVTWKWPGERLISQPRPVSALNHKDMQLHLVAASDAATVVVTSKGDVYVLHEYQCRKIITKFVDFSFL